ncbi:hypothetical protein ACFC14_18655 [Microbacterium sp. NPDC055988]|uniref:hypothetical protein n=1 Tax=Microbacterium sp. NPDC055988 TaxID=3345671 RepID=UPI0035D69EF7
MEFESCWACDRMPDEWSTAIPAPLLEELHSSDQIGLCVPHWRWWLARWLSPAHRDRPPCIAWLVPGLNP